MRKNLILVLRRTSVCEKRLQGQSGEAIRRLAAIVQVS